jgi:hypothetical protein
VIEQCVSVVGEIAGIEIGKLVIIVGGGGDGTGCDGSK